jgi:hypothetical protein
LYTALKLLIFTVPRGESLSMRKYVRSSDDLLEIFHDRVGPIVFVSVSVSDARLSEETKLNWRAPLDKGDQLSP